MIEKTALLPNDRATSPPSTLTSHRGQRAFFVGFAIVDFERWFRYKHSHSCLDAFVFTPVARSPAGFCFRTLKHALTCR